MRNAELHGLGERVKSFRPVRLRNWRWFRDVLRVKCPGAELGVPGPSDPAPSCDSRQPDAINCVTVEVGAEAEVRAAWVGGGHPC